MKAMKQSMLVGASVVTLGLVGLSGARLVSAATNSTSSTSSDSLVDKIASKFNLDKSQVQAVFDEDRKNHLADKEAKGAEALKQAVADGKLTQAQADHITATWNEINALRGTTSFEDTSDATRDQIKQKLEDLRTWLEDQNIDLKELGIMGPRHGHGFGGPGMGHGADDSSSSSSMSTTTN